MGVLQWLLSHPSQKLLSRSVSSGSWSRGAQTNQLRHRCLWVQMPSVYLRVGKLCTSQNRTTGTMQTWRTRPPSGMRRHLTFTGIGVGAPRLTDAPSGPERGRTQCPSTRKILYGGGSRMPLVLSSGVAHPEASASSNCRREGSGILVPHYGIAYAWASMASHCRYEACRLLWLCIFGVAHSRAEFV